jgi:hypothetical protein
MNFETTRLKCRPRNRQQDVVREGGWKNSGWRRVAGKVYNRETSKEQSHSAHANEMNEYMNELMNEELRISYRICTE